MRHIPPSVRQSYRLRIFLCAVALMATPCPAQSSQLIPAASEDTIPRKGPTRDVIDEATLRAQAKLANQTLATLATKTQPLPAQPPSTASSLLTSSVFISDGDKFTIVPIGSVLVLPPNLRSKIIPKPQGDILMWPDFLKRNSAWIAAKEVTLPMSQGDTKAAATVMRELTGETRLVVAVYNGCPITVLEPAKNPPSSYQKK